MDHFLKIFRSSLFSKVLYMGMFLCSWLKFSICDIYNMFRTIFIQYFTQNLLTFYANSRIQFDHLIIDDTIIWLCSYRIEIYVLYLKTSFCFTIEPLLLNMSTANIDKALSERFSQCRSIADEHTFVNRMSQTSTAYENFEFCCSQQKLP